MERAYDHLPPGKAAGTIRETLAMYIRQKLCPHPRHFVNSCRAPVSFPIEATLHHETIDAPRRLPLMHRVPIQVVAARHEQRRLRVKSRPQLCRRHHSIGHVVVDPARLRGQGISLQMRQAWLNRRARELWASVNLDVDDDGHATGRQQLHAMAGSPPCSTFTRKRAGREQAAQRLRHR